MKTNLETIRDSYPKYTVYICRDTDGVINQLQPFDVYAKAERTYEQCKEKLASRPKEEGCFIWEEKQDKDLYEISLLLKRERSVNVKQDVIHNRLLQVVYDLEEICEELDDDDEQKSY